MGILKTTRKVTAEEKEYQLKNLKRLKSDFDVTGTISAGGESEKLFIYDAGRRCFVIADKPEKNFRLRNPYIVDFDQVKSVSIDGGAAETVCITIRTAHPFAGYISFRSGSIKDAERIGKIIQESLDSSCTDG